MNRKIRILLLLPLLLLMVSCNYQEMSSLKTLYGIIDSFFFVKERNYGNFNFNIDIKDNISAQADNSSKKYATYRVNGVDIKMDTSARRKFDIEMERKNDEMRKAECEGPRPTGKYLYEFPEGTMDAILERMVGNMCVTIGSRDYQNFRGSMAGFRKTLKQYTGYCYDINDPVIQKKFICTSRHLNMVTYAVSTNSIGPFLSYMLSNRKIDVNSLDPFNCTALDRIQDRLRYLEKNLEPKLESLEQNKMNMDSFTYEQKKERLIREVEQWKIYEASLIGFRARNNPGCKIPDKMPPLNWFLNH